MKNNRLRNKITISMGMNESIQKPKLSICITVKNRSAIRHQNTTLNLLPNCLKSIINSIDNNIEIIITDWYSTDWPLNQWVPEILRNHNYKIITINGPFSRGKGLNIAANHSQSDLLLFLDADMIITPQFVEYIINNTNKGQSCFPICKLCEPNGKSRRYSKNAYGNCCVHRHDFFKIKWIEKYSWGYEDVTLYNSLTTNKIRERRHDLKHQWHPSELSHIHYQNK